MTQLLSKQQKKLLVPLGFGSLIGLVGAIVAGKLVSMDSSDSDEAFLLLLLFCVGLGASGTWGITEFMANRRAKELAAEQLRTAPLSLGEHDTKKLSTLSGTTKTNLKSSVTSTLVGLHEVRYEPLPYRPPRIHLTGEEAFQDPYANDKLGTIMEDVYTTKSLVDIVKRVRTEVAKNARGDSEQHFRLSVFRSEGPVTPNGRCGTGWTFYFVREDESHGCIATATRHELSMQYASTKDVELAYTLDGSPSTEPIKLEPLPDIEAVLALVHEEVPGSKDTPLYVRGLPANNILVYTQDASAIADIVVEKDGLRMTNRAQFAERLKAYQACANAEDAWQIEDILAWFRTGETDNEALRALMARTGADVAFASGDKMLFRRIGRGLHAAHGEHLTALLDTAIEDILRSENTDDSVESLSQTSLDEAKLLIRCLAFVPTAAAMARLHSFSQKIRADLRPFVVDMFQARRRRLHGTETDLIDRLDFKELQHAKGFTRVVSMGIKYNKQNLREDILDRLARELNLQVYRVRVVTHRSNYTKTIRYDGKSEEYSALRHGMITGAWLRTANGDCEVQINVIPSPVLVQYWYLSGPAAWSVARDLRRMKGWEYTTEELQENLTSIEVGRRSALMRAVATLQIWDPSCRPEGAAQYLIDAYRDDISRGAWQLRQFIIDTLIYIRDMPSENATPESVEEQRAQINAFFHALRAEDADAESRNRYEIRLMRRVQEALGDTSISTVGIVQPAISLIRDDLLPAPEETSDTENAASYAEADNAEDADQERGGENSDDG